ncbi:MAG: alpha/beta family hydrolase [Actinomycetota bacterium]|nr:alpha/beta family hydrolase [Actinomycetota bacterium]
MTSEDAPVGAVLLTPGAGTDASHPSLVALEEALAPLPVARVDFPYRKEGRKAPDRAPKLIASLRDDAAAFAERTGVAPGRIALGGRSMGGRMCSMAVAEGLPAAGLVLIAYPLHPPGKPEKLRVEHLPDITVPCLFVSGTKDPFGTPDELEAATATIPGEVTHVWIEGARHDLRRKDEVVADAVVSWIASLGG